MIAGIRSEIRTSAMGFDGNLIHVDKEYDNLGRVKRQSEPYTGAVAQYWTTFTYDILGRVTQTQAPDGGVSSASYSGLTTTYTNALGQTRTEVKNGLGELVQVTDHMGGTASYTYDNQGNLKTLIQGGPGVSNVTTSISYDLLGRKAGMVDPDMGNWVYAYNAFGELISQTTATGDTTSMTYDLLGRMVSRTDTDGGTGAVEGDAAWIYDIATNGLGQLAHEDRQEGSTTVVSRDFAYDSFGRAQSVTTQIGSSSYSQQTTYDQFGRVFQQFDAAGDFYGLEYTYNAYGFLDAAYEARDSASTLKEYYKVLAMDHRGNVTSLRKGGLTVNRSFDEATGRASTITAFDSLNTPLQDLTLTFDLVGNLTRKIDQNRTLNGNYKNIDEDFDYDDLNRLLTVQKNNTTSLTLTYDALGNITSKSDVGSYSYGSRPHAVTSAGGVSYTYDLNGSMVSGDGRTLSYTAFNKPDYLTKGSSNITLAYGPNRSRYKRIDNVSGSVTTTHYVGNIEKIFKPSGLIET